MSRKRGTGYGEKGTLLHKVIDIANVRYCSNVDRTRGCHDTLYYWVPVGGVNPSVRGAPFDKLPSIGFLRQAQGERCTRNAGAACCAPTRQIRCSKRTLR